MAWHCERRAKYSLTRTPNQSNKKMIITRNVVGWFLFATTQHLNTWLDKDAHVPRPSLPTMACNARIFFLTVLSCINACEYISSENPFFLSFNSKHQIQFQSFIHSFIRPFIHLCQSVKILNAQHKIPNHRKENNNPSEDSLSHTNHLKWYIERSLFTKLAHDLAATSFQLSFQAMIFMVDSLMGHSE